MELYAKGQLSYLMLTCLQERDFYGLDIISEISNTSNGRINLKKPSVYSNLTRMEKQGYISSYLRNSDFGPNRKYYSLTEKGRNFYQELKEYFDKNNIDVFRDFQDFEEKEVSAPLSEVSSNENQDSNLEENDFFDFSSLKEEDNKEKQLQTSENTSSTENHNAFSNSQNLEKEDTKEDTTDTKEEKKDDAIFLSTEEVDDYNKRLYDISKDIHKIKRKRSFADDQIAMTATDPLYLSNEKVKDNIKDFKNSILENREKYQENRTNSFEYFKQKGIREKSSSPEIQIKEEVKNDARFITERLDVSKVEHAKKIAPPRINIVSENTKDTRLPAPNRDKSIDPSHREILNKLYSRTKDKNYAEEREDDIYDYNDLKDYYSSQDIAFNIYQKNMTKTRHNTNKLYFINSLIIFLACAVSSTVLYLILNNFSLTYAYTNFLYIVLPALLIIDVVIKLYNYKLYSGWYPKQIMPQWLMWLLFLLSVLIIVGLNFVFGMLLNPFSMYATTLILPLLMMILVLPVRYYLKRLIIVKFWR